MTSADAVAAVRRGLRVALPRASTPVTPNASAGRPIASASGRANVASIRMTPKNTISAPTATSQISLTTLGALRVFVRPYASTGSPRAMNASPNAARTLNGFGAGGGTSSIAAIGGMRAARTAGMTEEPTVTTSPTPMATTTVRASSTVGPSGTLKPKAPSSASRPSAARRPSPTPITDDTRPTTADSARTATTTWRPLAPIARNSPSSRVRCATRIENVLKMMKAATTSPIAAKPSSSWVSSDEEVVDGLPGLARGLRRELHVVRGPHRASRCARAAWRRPCPAPR